MSKSIAKVSVFGGKDRRGTWPQALGSVFVSVLFILILRWLVFEPYVIPSGSMQPTLLVHDHIFVNKFSFGIRVPFTDRWVWSFSTPERGDVIVFRSVEDDSVYVVKRVIGLPGDVIRVEADGEVWVNDQPLARERLSDAAAVELLPRGGSGRASQAYPGDPGDERFEYFLENHGGRSYLVMQERRRRSERMEAFAVPPDHLFMMGDNRDNSFDSRAWGALPVRRVLGRASFIWLSCEETLPQVNQLCDPHTIRWMRLFEGFR